MAPVLSPIPPAIPKAIGKPEGYDKGIRQIQTEIELKNATINRRWALWRVIGTVTNQSRRFLALRGDSSGNKQREEKSIVPSAPKAIATHI